MTVTHAPMHVRLFPPHGKVTEVEDEYVVELDVPEFTQAELSFRADGEMITVTGDQHRDEDALTLCEHLEEWFRVPHDGRVDEMRVDFDAGKLELRIPRKRFRVNPDATPC